ncbi:MAG: response regulator [Lachnospiraceae bacterium]|jgi:two-component system sensor histidine kinase/response regulator|nr:response regulator [Lachnospiraceae bacterium]
MSKKIKKFLGFSLTGMVVLCIGIFAWMMQYMDQKSTEAIRAIGELYMLEVNDQLEQKFSAITDLRLDQVGGIIRGTAAGNFESVEQLQNQLASSAGVREFEFLGLYTADGEGQVIYGNAIEPIDRREFEEALIDGEKGLSSAYSESGEKLLLLIQEAQYPMSDGRTSCAVVVGIPMDYLNEAMALDTDGALVYSHIIRRDGSYVIRNGEAFRDNYFNRIVEICSEFNGKTPEQYVEELQNAMTEDKDYSALLMEGGVHRHLYCSALPGSEWYLVSIMPYGVLDDAVNNLSNERSITVLGVCSVILLGLGGVFFVYFQMSRQQMKELEAARQEALRANHAKSEFLSNMSHDIRTPMNGIVGMTAIAMANMDDSARVQDCLKKITLSSRHLLGLINDVLDMSKIESGRLSLNMDQLSLRDTMDSIVNIVQPQIRSRKQHFDVFIQKIETEDVYCDSVRLNQILINLLSNAVKFTPEGGVINVYLSQESSPLGENFVRCHFRVKDSGIGMTPEFQKEIFDTFTREKNQQVDKTEGTGLGMAITKYIVDAMKGTIEVTSAVGKGSEFHVTLDLEKALTKIEDMFLPAWNILVVDNNEDLCRSAVDALKEIGVSPEWALDGRTAVQMVEKRHREHNDYHFVLLDWRMPDMDGVQTTREIRKRVGDAVPILIISAYDWSDIEEEAKEAGVHGFISKPLFKSNLYLGLSHYMEGESEEPEEEENDSQEFAGMRVLLAEDNDLNWEIAEDILSEAGFELERAENGKICAEMFEKSEPYYYDLVLMDIRMPVMTGYDAAVRIRATERPDSGLPIIAMTADAFSEDIKRCLECGMNAHIAKPIDVQILIQHLRKYLKKDSEE